MSDNEIVEGNLLIAKFMDGNRSKVDGKGKWMRFPEPTHGHYSFRYNNLQYDQSWDWLMPVIQKIKQLQWDSVKNYDLGFEADLVLRLEIWTPIEQVWKAVIDFIKWHNSQPTKPSQTS